MSAENKKSFKKNDVIFREGDVESCMYEIYTGSVGIYSGYGTAAEKLLNVLNVSDSYFGEMGMIDNEPRSATAVALEDGTILTVISADDLDAYYKKNPSKVLSIMQHMSSRLRELTKNYVSACRTASEIVDNEASGAADSEDLQQRQQHFAAVYQAGRKGQ